MMFGSRPGPLLPRGRTTWWERSFARIGRVPTTLVCVILATACSDGSITPGIETLWQAQLSAQPTAPAGPKSFETTEGLPVTLSSGYLTISSAAIATDCNQPGFVLNPLDWLLPVAYAHTDTTASQLGAPTVIDLTGADIEPVELGRLYPAAGDYCGGRWQITAADDDAQGLPATPDMVGYSLRLSGHYGPGTDQFSVDTTISLLPIERRFATTAALDGEQRTATVTLALQYDRWFDGVDMAALNNGDRNALEVLLNNLRSAVTVTVERR